MGKTIELCNHDIRKLIKNDASKMQFHLPPKMPFSVGIDCDAAMYKDIADDALTLQKIHDIAAKEYQGLLKKVTQDVTSINKEMRGKGKRNQRLSAWEKQYKSDVDQAVKTITTNVGKELEKWRKTKEDRKAYKYKVAADITIGSASLVAATVGSVAACTASTVTAPAVMVALYANAKAAISLYKQLKTLCESMETSEKNLQHTLDKVTSEYADLGKTATTAEELIKMAYERFTTKEKASIARCNSELKTFHGKLSGVQENLKEMGKKLNGILDQQKAVDDKIVTKITTMLKDGGYKSKKLPKLCTQSRKLRTAIDLQFDKLVKLNKSVTRAEARENKYEEAVKELNSNTYEKAVKFIGIALALPDIGMGAAVTDFKSVVEVLVLVAGIEAEIDSIVAEEVIDA